MFTVKELRTLIREAISDVYAVLGLSPQASPDEVKAAYRSLAIKLHPDRNKDNPEAAAKMVKANVAYGILTDPIKRNSYMMKGDRTIDGSPQPRPAAPPSPRPNPGPGPAPRPNTPPPGDVSPKIRRTFYYSDKNRGGNSDKFWQVEYVDNRPPSWSGAWEVIVRWGRRGTMGQSQVRMFKTRDEMKKWLDKKVREQLAQGYQESLNANRPNNNNAGTPPPSAKRPEPTGKARASKKNYKVYGPKRGAKIHTRVGGRVYIPTGQTKFSKGDNPEVAVGSDGRASVMDPKTGHTQTWDGFDEAVKYINRLVLEAVMK